MLFYHKNERRQEKKGEMNYKSNFQAKQRKGVDDRLQESVNSYKLVNDLLSFHILSFSFLYSFFYIFYFLLPLSFLFVNFFYHFGNAFQFCLCSSEIGVYLLDSTYCHILCKLCSFPLSVPL